VVVVLVVLVVLMVVVVWWCGGKFNNVLDATVSHITHHTHLQAYTVALVLTAGAFAA
jgi:hypothetical protein